MAQYMLLIYDDEATWAGMSEDEQQAVMGEYFAYTEELRKAGAYVAGDALQPIGTATTVRVRDGEQLLTDGPFAETKEQLGGYYLVDVDSIDDAVRWAAKIPSARYGSIEVRPVVVFDREEVGA
ncbi:MAG TPA: YciI family protein [Gaiellaceae bacterium]|nr:YciI family protein [Gaiellaceae bacterium]